MNFASVFRPNRRRPTKRPRTLAGATALGVLLSLSACDPADQSLFAPACPQVSIVGEAADSYRYDGRSLDVGSLVSHASMTGLTGNCVGAEKHAIRTRVSVSMNVTRGAAARSSDIDLPYFIAVVHNGTIIDKKIFTATAQFDANVSTTTLQTPVASIDVPGGRDNDGQSYTLEVGFQLDRAQLDYNHTHLTPAGFHTIPGQ